MIGLVLLLLIGCSFDSTPIDDSAIQVGDISVHRREDKPQTYRMGLFIVNNREHRLLSFEVGGTLSTEIPAAHNAAETSAITLPLALYGTCSIDPHTAETIQLDFHLPFSFIPADGIELSQIRLHSFVFTHGPGAQEPLQYPYPVKETR